MQTKMGISVDIERFASFLSIAYLHLFICIVDFERFDVFLAVQCQNDNKKQFFPFLRERIMC